MQIGIPYIITGPDGTRAVVGNSDAAKADPDWCGYLNPQNGASIARTLRASVDDLSDADGGIVGDSWRGAATIALNGVLDPNAVAATLNALEKKLRRAVRAQHADLQLRYTPDGDLERSWWARLAAEPDIGGGFGPWPFALQLISQRPWALSPAEMNQLIIPGSAAGEVGVSSPIVSPLSSPINTTGQSTITPGGDVDTWPRFRLTGPITNPRIVNQTLGLEVRLLWTLAAGDVMDVYPETGRVLVNGADAYRAYDRANSRWWQLRAGLPNDVRLLATVYSAGASLTVYWRNAWEV